MAENNGRDSSQTFERNSTRLRTDGGPEQPDSEQSDSEETSDQGFISKFTDKIGIGNDHRQPQNEVKETLNEDSDVSSAEELTEELSDLDEVVTEYDGVRSELEADLQATAQAYETEISEPAVDVAEKLNAVFSVAESDLQHTYDFSPDRGTHSLDYEGPEESATATDYNLDFEEGLATFLEEGARVGDKAANLHEEVQIDMAELADKKEKLNTKLDNLKERNEDQLEDTRSEFSTEEEKERAEKVKEAEDSADEQGIQEDLKEVNEKLDRKRPRKEEHLDVRNSVLEEVRSTYESYSDNVESQVRAISEEVEYLTDSLDQLTDVEIGSMEEMLEDAFANTEVDLGPVGKYLKDAEGDLKDAYRQAVNDLTTQVARQYAQAEKAIEEMTVVEEGIERHTDRLDLGTAQELRETVEEAYDGDDMEAYLEEQVSGVLDATYSARDEIRGVFRGLEELRDREQLAE